MTGDDFCSARVEAATEVLLRGELTCDLRYFPETRHSVTRVDNDKHLPTLSLAARQVHSIEEVSLNPAHVSRNIGVAQPMGCETPRLRDTGR